MLGSVALSFNTHNLPPPSHRGEWWGEGGYARVAMGSSPNGPCGLFLYDPLVPLKTSSWPRAPPPLPPPSPPPPSPPISSDPPEGDLCYFYEKIDAPPYRLVVNASSCECYNICASVAERRCVFRQAGAC